MYGREEEGKGTGRKRQAETEVSGNPTAKTVAVQGKGNICQKSSLLLENEQENGHEPHESSSGKVGRGGPGANSLGERDFRPLWLMSTYHLFLVEVSPSDLIRLNFEECLPSGF